MHPKEVQKIVAERGDRMSEELAAQFDNLFHVLCVTIKRLSWKQWSSGNTPERTPARVACHIIGPCESYVTGKYNSCYRRFGINVNLIDDDIHPEQLPTPRQVVEYAEEVRQLVRDWLGNLSN